MTQAETRHRNQESPRLHASSSDEAPGSSERTPRKTQEANADSGYPLAADPLHHLALSDRSYQHTQGGILCQAEHSSRKKRPMRSATQRYFVIVFSALIHSCLIFAIH